MSRKWDLKEKKNNSHYCDWTRKKKKLMCTHSYSITRFKIVRFSLKLIKTGKNRTLKIGAFYTHDNKRREGAIVGFSLVL